MIAEANLARVIRESLPTTRQHPTFGAIRGWLEGQGDGWLHDFVSGDAGAGAFSDLQADLPVVTDLAGAQGAAAVIAAVREEAANILRRRIAESRPRRREEAMYAFFAQHRGA